VTKLICTFERPDTPIEGYAVTGYVLLTLTAREPEERNEVRVQARLEGLSAGTEHSFHFHQWGDMTVPFDQLGEIYSSQGIDVNDLTVNSDGIAIYDRVFQSPALGQHVGRALTLHAGNDRSTPTVAAAVCGLAHPRAKLETGITHGAAAKRSVSLRLVAGLIFVAVCVLVFLIVACLYHYRKPIPLCGTCIYGKDAHALQYKSAAAPPPHAPPPPVAAVSVPGSQPPPPPSQPPPPLGPPPAGLTTDKV